MDTANVRYLVDDVASATAFYRDHLGFRLLMKPSPGFAMLSRGCLRLLLNTPGGGGGAGQPMRDGRLPQPGGWNRFQLPVIDLDREVAALGLAEAVFRSDIITGRGGRQILLEDPSGNPIELFEPTPA